jgi:hypothetical protein
MRALRNFLQPQDAEHGHERGQQQHHAEANAETYTNSKILHFYFFYPNGNKTAAKFWPQGTDSLFLCRTVLGSTLLQAMVNNGSREADLSVQCRRRAGRRGCGAAASKEGGGFGPLCEHCMRV